MEISDYQPEELRKVTDACLEHAIELLDTAGQALDDGKHHIAYQLAALAIEEFGKADLLAVNHIASQQGTPSRRFQEQTTDHVRKLWWALWTHLFAQGKLSHKIIRETQGRAKEIDQKRREAAYVGVDVEDFKPPKECVTEEEARELIALVAAMIEQEFKRLRPPEPEDREALAWFMVASEDVEKRKLIVGPGSLEKLGEFGNVPDWMRWLKKIFDEQEANNQELMQKELKRERPEGEDQFEHKWRLKVRLVCASHSIARQQILNTWNDEVDWIKLNRVDRRKDALDVDFFLPAGVPIHGLWQTGFDVSRKFAAALNIGSFGFFWWNMADHLAAYYEKVIDLESDVQVQIERNPALKIDWRRGTLDEQALRNTQLLFATLVRMGEMPLALQYYLSGVAALSKIDVHFQLEQECFMQFIGALNTGLKDFEDWDEDEEDFPTALSQFFSETISDPDEIPMLLDLADKVRKGKDRVKEITLEEVAKVKVLCDALFLPALRRIAHEQFSAYENSDDDEPEETPPEQT
jgi:AbiV family abortive infection protein